MKRAGRLQYLSLISAQSGSGLGELEEALEVSFLQVSSFPPLLFP